MKNFLYFLKPNITKIVFLIIIVIIAKFYGIKICDSGCPLARYECIVNCNNSFLYPILFPFYYLTNTEIYNYPSWFYIFSLLWWYILSCIIYWPFNLTFKKK